MRYQTLLKEIAEWKDENIISQEQFEILEARYKPKQQKIEKVYKKFSTQKLMTTVMIIIVVLGSLGWIAQIYPSFNNIVVFGALIFGVGALLLFGEYLDDKNMNIIRGIGKVLILLGCLLTTFIIFYSDIKIFNKIGISLSGNDWSFYILVSALILTLVGYLLREKVVIGYSCFLYTIWFISQSKIHAGGYTTEWLGLSLPSRLVLFSLIFFILGHFHGKGFKLKNNEISLKKYSFFQNTYYISGLLISFIAAFQASLGNWLTNPLFQINLEATVFLMLGFVISIYTVYFGLIKEKVGYIFIGLIFFSIQVLGKIYQTLHSDGSNILFYIVFIIAFVFIAGVFEYTLTHKRQLKKELLNTNKG